jgi:hypothetical protein
MAGNSNVSNKDRGSVPRFILQPRDLHLERELAILRVVDREQAKIVAGFKSTTRANTRLLTLTRAGLLKRFFLGSGGGRKALYSLSPKGAQLAGVPYRGLRRRQDEILVADFFIEHQLTVNELYCTLKYKPIPMPGVTFSRWIAFHDQFTSAKSLIPDGYVEMGTPDGIVSSFVEVDLGHEGLAVWKEKGQNYLQLAVSGDYQKQFGQERFRVLVLVSSERRLHSIRRTLAATTEKIFWFATLDAVRDNFFASVWFRPAGDQPKPFLEEHL